MSKTNPIHLIIPLQTFKPFELTNVLNKNKQINHITFRTCFKKLTNITVCFRITEHSKLNNNSGYSVRLHNVPITKLTKEYKLPFTAWLKIVQSTTEAFKLQQPQTAI